jgi:acetyltransferase-like isoleucine patch superfamily enzyme
MSVESCIHFVSRVKSRLFTAIIRREFATFGEKSVVCPPFRFANLKSIQVEDHVTINKDCWILVLRNTRHTLTPRILIQSGAGIGMGATISAAAEVVIGRNAMLARNVYISDHKHAYDDVEQDISSQGISEPEPVRIGDGAWLGQNVCVLPGVQIGKHSIIGANAVVTKSVPDFSIAVGSPAVVIKKYNPITRSWERCASSSFASRIAAAV